MHTPSETNRRGEAEVYRLCCSCGNDDIEYSSSPMRMIMMDNPVVSQRLHTELYIVTIAPTIVDWLLRLFDPH